MEHFNTTHFLKFFGKAFRGAQLNYSMPAKELYAIVFGLHNNHHICYGRHINILTDSNVLTYYHTVQADSRMLVNWYDILGRYNFSISHIPGDTNILPDALSRFNLTSRQSQLQINSMTLTTTEDWKLNPDLFKIFLEHYDATEKISLGSK